MAEVLSPATEAELSQAIRDARGPFELLSLGTKRGLGRPVQAEATLDLSRFSSIVVYEPEELILETGPGARLADITAMIGTRGQELAFEPPDYSRILGSGGSGSIGGLVSCNLSGPRRIKAGAARDHVLGVKGATGTGEIYKAGARVVKNVTGYDLPKLATGAYGTLTAMTSIILKVLPGPRRKKPSRSKRRTMRTPCG